MNDLASGAWTQRVAPKERTHPSVHLDIACAPGRQMKDRIRSYRNCTSTAVRLPLATGVRPRQLPQQPDTGVLPTKLCSGVPSIAPTRLSAFRRRALADKTADCALMVSAAAPRTEHAGRAPWHFRRDHPETSCGRCRCRRHHKRGQRVCCDYPAMTISGCGRTIYQPHCVDARPIARLPKKARQPKEANVDKDKMFRWSQHGWPLNRFQTHTVRMFERAGKHAASPERGDRWRRQRGQSATIHRTWVRQR